FKRGNLGFGSAFTAADNSPGVAHATSGRCGGSRDESSDGFFAILCDPFSGFFFSAAADFADHDDAVGFRIVIKQLDNIEVRSAVYGVAADTDAGGLTDAARRELPHRFVGQG